MEGRFSCISRLRLRFRVRDRHIADALTRSEFGARGVASGLGICRRFLRSTLDSFDWGTCWGGALRRFMISGLDRPEGPHRADAVHWRSQAVFRASSSEE